MGDHQWPHSPIANATCPACTCRCFIPPAWSAWEMRCPLCLTAVAPDQPVFASIHVTVPPPPPQPHTSIGAVYVGGHFRRGRWVTGHFRRR